MMIERLLEQLDPDTMPNGCHLSAYTVEQCYGGPEEGGWWYSWYTFQGAKRYETTEAAEAARDRLVAWIREQNKQEQDRANRVTAALPDDPGPYLDTEGYIPTGWSDGGKTELMIESEAGGYAANQEVPYYC